MKNKNRKQTQKVTVLYKREEKDGSKNKGSRIIGRTELHAVYMRCKLPNHYLKID